MLTVVKKSKLAHLSQIVSKDILDHYEKLRGDDLAFIKIKEYYPRVTECADQKCGVMPECEEVFSQAYAACLDFYGIFSFNLVDDITGESTYIHMKL